MPRSQVPSIPSRLQAHPDYAGRGVVMGFIDVGFYPHPDLMRPTRRVRAYGDVTRDEPVADEFFSPQPYGWHGMMTACTAAGNGYVSSGQFRGLASEAEVVLIKAGVGRGRVVGANVASALRFPLRYPQLGIQVLNISLGVSPDDPDLDDVERAVREVVEAGVTVVAAAGNRRDRPPGPPGSAPEAITLGGLDDRCVGDPTDEALYPFSHGSPHPGVQKPDLLAPAIWLPAPMLPGTLTAREAGPLFQMLSILEEMSAEHGFSERHQWSTPEERASIAELIHAVEARIQKQKYISPEYQHVEGTSFAAPIAASVAAQMLEACPSLTPAEIREGLVETAEPVLNVAATIQGAGVLRPLRAVEWAVEKAASRPSKIASIELSDGAPATEDT
jgi:serine protease AprX